jgi:hypothetical protein
MISFEELFTSHYKIVIKEQAEGQLPQVVLINPTRDEMDDDYCLNKYMTSVIKIATSAK